RRDHRRRGGRRGRRGRRARGHRHPPLRAGARRMSPDLILILPPVLALPTALWLLFTTLWRVPKADEALIITGFGVKGAPARRAEIELGPDGQPTPAASAAGTT